MRRLSEAEDLGKAKDGDVKGVEKTCCKKKATDSRCLRLTEWVGSVEDVLRQEVVFSREVAPADCHCPQAKRQAMRKSM